eukprot:CAMPEP_0171134898 /NCGR_PEP_ID=MMETSP0766_2-20121228/128823_1 /TAXON_ID=439317 /ORGANISM="Gambierdiscus australes, Strain CAWD 149" /LENGTH=65 /DNA_ID=CAMNT_0011598375 /DNA_START=24 /DNA_END=217 /DNA_ORIENTATION=-
MAVPMPTPLLIHAGVVVRCASRSRSNGWPGNRSAGIAPLDSGASMPSPASRSAGCSPSATPKMAS